MLCPGSLARVPEQVGTLRDNAGGAWRVSGSALKVGTPCPSWASGLSKPHGQQWEEEFGEHPRVLVSSSRAPSNPFSIIKQAKPKNSAELYYMWQDNLRGEQGTKCPHCPNLPLAPAPRGDSMGAGTVPVGSWIPRGAPGLWGVFFCRRGSGSTSGVSLGLGRARLGVPRCREEGARIWAPIPAPRLLHLGTHRWSPKEAGGPATRPTVTSAWE